MDISDFSGGFNVELAIALFAIAAFFEFMFMDGGFLLFSLFFGDSGGDDSLGG